MVSKVIVDAKSAILSHGNGKLDFSERYGQRGHSSLSIRMRVKPVGAGSRSLPEYRT